MLRFTPPFLADSGARRCVPFLSRAEHIYMYFAVFGVARPAMKQVGIQRCNICLHPDALLRLTGFCGCMYSYNSYSYSSTVSTAVAVLFCWRQWSRLYSRAVVVLLAHPCRLGIALSAHTAQYSSTRCVQQKKDLDRFFPPVLFVLLLYSSSIKILYFCPRVFVSRAAPRRGVHVQRGDSPGRGGRVRGQRQEGRPSSMLWWV